MGGATPVCSEKIILEVPADFPLNTTFVSRCLKVGKIHLVLFHPPKMTGITKPNFFSSDSAL